VREPGDAFLALIERREHVMTIRRPSGYDGLISIARTQRGSVTPVSVTGRNHLSCVRAASVYGGDLRMRSGSPNCFENCQPVGSGKVAGGGRSLGSPSGAPASTQETIVLICSSERLRSFLKARTPMFLSTCHGGITRAATLVLMALANRFASA
jgi:hypothetical protein